MNHFCGYTEPEARCTLPSRHAGPHSMAKIGESGPLDDPIPPAKDISDHERIMARAIDIVEQHTSEHGELWREADPTELGAMVKHKANRVNYAARRFQEGQGVEGAKRRIIDSALDCINYCGFIIQAVERDG